MTGSSQLLRPTMTRLRLPCVVDDSQLLTLPVAMVRGLPSVHINTNSSYESCYSYESLVSRIVFTDDIVTHNAP